MDPQQEIFTELLLKIKALGYDVFDGELPPENTPYPLYILGICSRQTVIQKQRLLVAHSLLSISGTAAQRNGEQYQRCCGKSNLCAGG